MSFQTPWAVILTILFIIPGFLWKKTANLFAGYSVKSRFAWDEYLALSCLNYLFALPTIAVLLLFCPTNLVLDEIPAASPCAFISLCAKHPVYFFLLCFIPVFVIPAVLGAVTARLLCAQRIRGFLRRFGMAVLHPAPTAWDYAFARQEHYWARVELTDGNVVDGIWGHNSLASGELEDRDLFLEDLFAFDHDAGRYRRIRGNAGLLVSADNIRTITFFDLPDLRPLCDEAEENHKVHTDKVQQKGNERSTIDKEKLHG